MLAMELNNEQQVLAWVPWGHAGCSRAGVEVRVHVQCMPRNKNVNQNAKFQSWKHGDLADVGNELSGSAGGHAEKVDSIATGCVRASTRA